MALQHCGSCHLKAIFGRMKPRCLQGNQERDKINAVEAEVRQHTLEDILFSPRSLEVEAIGAPSPRRHTPKVCPLNLLYSYENNSPNVNESFSIDRISLRSQNSIARRVSFRLPDESDIFIIPARKDSEDDSNDDESTDDVSEEGIGAKKNHHGKHRF